MKTWQEDEDKIKWASEYTGWEFGMYGAHSWVYAKKEIGGEERYYNRRVRGSHPLSDRVHEIIEMIEKDYPELLRTHKLKKDAYLGVM